MLYFILDDIVNGQLLFLLSMVSNDHVKDGKIEVTMESEQIVFLRIFSIFSFITREWIEVQFVEKIIKVWYNVVIS